MLNQRCLPCPTQKHCQVLGLLAIPVSIAKGGSVTARFFNIAEFGKATELKMVC
jgi:hypothetical protein